MNVGTAIITAFLRVVYELLGFYMWCIIIGAILSWLVAFNIINPHNRLVAVVGDFIYRITEPALRRIRRILPLMGNIDLSPLALIFLINFLQYFIRNLMFSAVM